MSWRNCLNTEEVVDVLILNRYIVNFSVNHKFYSFKYFCNDLSPTIYIQFQKEVVP